MLQGIADADCPYVLLSKCLMLHVGSHKRRAALAKKVKIIILLYKHGYSSFCEFDVSHYTPVFCVCQ